MNTRRMIRWWGASGLCLSLLLLRPLAPLAGGGRADAPASTGTLRGTVWDYSRLPLAGVTVRVLGAALPPALTDSAGQYTIPGVPAGIGYNVIYGLLPGYGAAAESVAVVAGLPTSVNVELPTAFTFEDGPDLFTGQYPWQWGVPESVGPPTAFSGTKCWGTNLSGDYPDGVLAYLTGHVLDPIVVPRMWLSFTHWYDIRDGDGGNVQVSNGVTWNTVAPVGGYPIASIAALGGQPGWSGASGGWQPAVVDITPYTHGHYTVRFQFGSDASGHAPGWYIDDVAIYATGNDSGVGPANGGAPASADSWLRLAPAQPNPFRNQSVIAFRPASDGGRARLRILDVTGGVVRTLYEAGGASTWQEVVWDGRDGGGHDVPAGVYYCVLESGGSVASRSIVRIR